MYETSAQLPYPLVRYPPASLNIFRIESKIVSPDRPLLTVTNPFSYHLIEASSVSELQYQLFEKSTIPISEQRLIFGSHQLSTNQSLESYGLRSGNTINLALR